MQEFAGEEASMSYVEEHKDLKLQDRLHVPQVALLC